MLRACEFKCEMCKICESVPSPVGRPFFGRVVEMKMREVQVRFLKHGWWKFGCVASDSNPDGKNLSSWMVNLRK